MLLKWGGSWRMPTKAEQDDLRNNCTWTWYSSENTEFNGVAGYKVTSNIEGYTDRFIFLPAAPAIGYRPITGHSDADSFGYYWSSSLFTDIPYLAYVLGDFHPGGGLESYGRIVGSFVRPVCP